MHNKQASLWDTITTGETDDSFIRRRGEEHAAGASFVGGGMGAAVGALASHQLSSIFTKNKKLRGAAIAAGALAGVGLGAMGGAYTSRNRGESAAIEGDTGLLNFWDINRDLGSGSLLGGGIALAASGEHHTGPISVIKALGDTESAPQILRRNRVLKGLGIGAGVAGLGYLGSRLYAKYTAEDPDVTRTGLGTMDDYKTREMLRDIRRDTIEAAKTGATVYNKQASFWDRVTTGESDDDFIRRRGAEGQQAGRITGGVLGAGMGLGFGALGGATLGALKGRGAGGAAIGATLGAGLLGGAGALANGWFGRRRGVSDAVEGEAESSSNLLAGGALSTAVGAGAGLKTYRDMGAVLSPEDIAIAASGAGRSIAEMEDMAKAIRRRATGVAGLGATALTGLGIAGASYGTRKLRDYLAPDAGVTRDISGTVDDYYNREKARNKTSSVRGLSSHYLCGY